MEDALGVEARPASLDDSANILLELAGLFQAGRAEPAMTNRASAPHAHRDVGDACNDFARFAFDQYEDAVALLAALSTKLSDASSGYQQSDAEAQRRMDGFLRDGTFKAGG